LRHFQAHKNRDLAFAVIETHYKDPGYVSAMASLLKNAAAGAEKDLKTHIIFAAHSIPVKYTRRGDPYIRQVEETAALIYRQSKMDLPYSIAFQSRIGPVKWHGPTLQEELDRLVQAGVLQLIVQPVSFVTENLETLYDLDIELKSHCELKGIQSFLRVPVPGSEDAYIEALSKLVKKTVKNGGAREI
jgi:ferrochelatase